MFFVTPFGARQISTGLYAKCHQEAPPLRSALAAALQSNQVRHSACDLAIWSSHRCRNLSWYINMYLHEFIIRVYVNLCEFMMCLLNPFEPWIFGWHCSLPTPTCANFVKPRQRAKKQWRSSNCDDIVPQNARKLRKTFWYKSDRIWSSYAQNESTNFRNRFTCS